MKYQCLFLILIVALVAPTTAQAAPASIAPKSTTVQIDPCVEQQGEYLTHNAPMAPFEVVWRYAEARCAVDRAVEEFQQGELPAEVVWMSQIIMLVQYGNYKLYARFIGPRTLPNFAQTQHWLELLQDLENEEIEVICPDGVIIHIIDQQGVRFDHWGIIQ